MTRLRALLLLPVIAVLMAAMTGTASAHAVLDSSTPADGSRLDRSPATVTLHFDEAVAPIARETRVLDESLRTVSTSVSKSRSSTVTIGLRPSLPVGTYIVQFRVISADSHPVTGTISFGVGVSPGAGAAANAPPPTAPHAVSLTLDVFRVAGWVALVLLAGLPLVCLLIWPVGLRTRRVQRLVWSGWILSYVSLLGEVLVRGPYDAAEGLGRSFDSGLLHATLSSRLGSLLEAQAVLLTVALPVLWALMPTTSTSAATSASAATPAPGPTERPPVFWSSAGAVLAVLLWGTNAAAGHAGAGFLWPLWTGVTAIHLAATATWLAGLTALAVVLLRRRHRSGSSDGALLRWSSVATVAVVLLLGTGTAQSLRSIDSVAELTATHYGKLLLIKVGLVAVMLLLGLLGRIWVRRNGGTNALRRTVTGELAIGIVVLAVTSALSTTAPGKDTYSPALHRTAHAAQIVVQVDIPHTRRGPQQITLHFRDAKGQPYRPVKVSGAYYEDDKDLGPLPVNYRQAGVVATGATTVLVPGTWRLRIIVQTSDVGAGIADVLYRVR
jgi:copper transport protein